MVNKHLFLVPAKYIVNIMQYQSGLSIVDILQKHEPIKFPDFLWNDIARTCHLFLIKYVQQRSDKYGDCIPGVLQDAACSGYLNIVRYAHEYHQIPCDYHDLVCAAQNGHLSIVQYMSTCITQNEYAKNSAVIHAAQSGHYDIVQFLYQTYEHDEDTLYTAKQLAHHAGLDIRFDRDQRTVLRLERAKAQRSKRIGYYSSDH